MAGIQQGAEPVILENKAKDNSLAPREWSTVFEYDTWRTENPQIPNPAYPGEGEPELIDPDPLQRRDEILADLKLPRYLEKRTLWAASKSDSDELSVVMAGEIVFMLEGRDVLRLPFDFNTRDAAFLSRPVGVIVGGQSGSGRGEAESRENDTLSFGPVTGAVPFLVQPWYFRLCCDRVQWRSKFRQIAPASTNVGLLAVRSETLQMWNPERAT